MKQYFTNEVKQVLDKVAIVKNLARKKFITSFVLALIQSRKVQFSHLAHYLNDEAKISCNQVRIQDFFREVDLDYQALACLLLCFLPQGKISLCIDRTEWDFGQCQVNILMVVATSGVLHVPLYWQLLENESGNSATDDRKAFLSQCIALVGKERIGMVVADREFIGHNWLSYLKSHGILFCIRVPKHHLITRLDGRQHRVEELLTKASELSLADCLVDGVWANVYIKKLRSGDILFLLGTVKVGLLGQLYRKRWTIETLFQNMKGRGFDLESTHLKLTDKLKKLIGLVSIAYGFCLTYGLYCHQKIKAIPKKKHGYKANSFFRYGLDCIGYAIRVEWNKDLIAFQTLMRLLSRTLRQVFQSSRLPNKIVG
ncbi:IS4 family transposase [Rhodocytophaga rosea]|uniref:IS4 family transposase n=1 Tax=Rhodocytophaga rosea TaxID=2704465 RepID=A0A6C0GSW3_9BACT|nr:IS4 family transposase [Rhodocytophaga rosea]QHT67114.1 IS4 family transposase [Rhodocytophaga rosea]QHT67603.1 IS4 family transposase [Rhodocytophaga rosea]QHT71116.1 IS4 family transposase [Rhodocytophaga rosea]